MELDRSYFYHEQASQKEVDLLWHRIIGYNMTSGPTPGYLPNESYRIVLKGEQDQVATEF